MKDNKRSQEQKHQHPAQHEQYKPQTPSSSPDQKGGNFPQNWPKKKDR